MEMANPPDDEDTTPSKDDDPQNSPGAGGAVLVRKTKDSNQRSPTNGEGEEELPPVDTLEACDKAAERSVIPLVVHCCQYRIYL
ncbi:hypothetical protein NPIL_503701 [Nephila pilipes]|uniref:Uncharacterized protein n=1 Tax=Nephila pilipes TaxID=299642 RepID=A0A8X6P3L2_NEPPI|nr:hypothetical protein NPIL_503701 [Nephila pilipes]